MNTLRLGVRQLSTAVPHVLSAVHRGVAYEQWSMKFLQEHFSMSLHRVGGRSDGGIDLQGYWWLPSGAEPLDRRRLRVLAQCKAEKKKIGPKYVREMEGVLMRFSATLGQSPALTPTLDTQLVATAGPHTVGIFISSSPFSKSTVLRANSSPLPMALLYLPSPEQEAPCSEAENELGSSMPGTIMFNAALGGSTGLLKGEFEPRWEYGMNVNSRGRPGLWWKGQRVHSYVPPDLPDGRAVLGEANA